MARNVIKLPDTTEAHRISQALITDDRPQVERDVRELARVVVELKDACEELTKFVQNFSIQVKNK